MRPLGEAGVVKILAYPRDPNPYQERLYRELRAGGDEVAYLDGPTPSQTLNLLLLPVMLLRRRSRGFEIFHLHWVFGFCPPWASASPRTRRAAQGWFELQLRLIKALGFKLVWTAHNLMPHRQVFEDDLRARRELAGRSDAVIALNRRSAARLESMGASQVDLVPQGPYADVLKVEPRERARRRLGIDRRSFVVLHAGLIASYKGVETLLEAAAELPAGSPIRVLVVGRCDDAALRQRIFDRAGRAGDRALLRLEWIPDEELGVYLGAADAAAFPFREVANSSSVMLALGAGLPVLLPDLPELADFPEGAVKRYRPGPRALSRALDELAELPLAERQRMAETGRSFAGSRSWGEVAAETRKVFERVQQAPPAGRVLMVSPYPPARDGIGAHARDLVRHLEATNEVAVLTRAGPGSGAGVHRLLTSSPACLPQALRAIRQFDPAVIHLQFAVPALGPAVVWAMAAASWARLTRGTRIVLTLHEVCRELAILKGGGEALYRTLARWADRCVVFTEENRQLLIARCGAEEGKVVRMEHGVAAPRPASGAASDTVRLRERYGLGRGPVVLSFGFVHPDKGTEHLVEAVRILRERRPGILDTATVLLAGAVRPRTGIFRWFERLDRSYLASIREQVSAAGLDGIVVFAGYVPDADVLPLFGVAECAVCPYTDVSQSGVINLAIAAGTPVLASDLPGLRENLPGGALFAPAADAPALAARLERILEDPALRTRLRRELESVREELSFSSAARRMNELYSELAGARPGREAPVG